METTQTCKVNKVAHRPSLGIVVDAEQRAEIVAEIMDKGVLVLTAGTNVIRLLPPLTISYEEMDEALAVMQSVLCK